MKRTKLSRQFLMNYIFIFAILVVFVGMVYFFNTAYLNDVHTITFDFEEIESDYLAFDLETALANQNLAAEDQLLVLNNDLEVIDSTSEEIPKGEQLDSETYNYYFIDDPDYDHLVEYMVSDESKFFILRYYAYAEYTDILFPLGLFFASLFIVFTIYFAKASSRKVAYPLQRLQEGVQEIKAGNLEHIIAFEANNELDDLKETINALSHKLKDEIALRKQVESNRQSLIRNVSHDIRTPLTNIIGYSDTLVDPHQKLNDSEVQNAIQLINRYGKQASHLVDELFELSSLELRRDENYPVSDLSEFLRLKLIGYVEELEMNGISYEIDIPETPMLTAFDTLGMHRVLDNLIHNSIKYNSGNFHMKFTLHQDKEWLHLIIEDDGIGIPKAFHESIFDPTVRVDPSRNSEISGTGLGLAIVRQIIENHQGRIRIDDGATGAKFIIELKKRS